MELSFRLTLLTLLLLFVVHRGYYTRKYRSTNDAQIDKNVPERNSRVANLIAVIALLSTALYLLRPTWIAWASLPFPLWLRWSGIVVALAGFGLLQWAHVALGRHWSDRPRLVQGQLLVSDGPYRWIRHPIYAAFLLILATPLFLSANWCIGVAWIAMTGLEVRDRSHIENGLLSAAFGEAYHAYREKTPALLPHLFAAKD